MDLIFLLLLLFGCAVSDVTKSAEPKSVESLTVSSTILTKTTNADEPKSKTEKRDSSDQTASYDAEKPKDEPFRPMYVQHYQQELAAATAPVPAYRPPTNVRYVAAPADAVAGATPQAYYDKPEPTGGIQYAATAHNAPATPANTAGGILYASSAYRGPFNPAYQQHQQQQHRIQVAAAAAPQQVKTPPANVAAPQPSPQTYAYAEPDTSYMYERVPQHQQQQQSSLPQQHHQHQAQQPHHHHQQQQQRPIYHRELLPPPQQQIQYVIAIPLSYMRQLQHQLSAIPSHASQAYALPSSSASHMLQSIGPLARDHQGMYRPYHHYAAAAATAATTTPDAVSSAEHAPSHPMQFIQLPASVILAAAKTLYQQQQQQQQPLAYQQHQQQQYYYTPPQHILMPPYHQQQQHQPVQQLYAYPVQQQQQHHQLQQQQSQQLQQKQQQPLHTVVRIGGVKPNQNAKLSQQHPQAASPQSPPTLAAPQSPLVHYSPVYVPAPPPTEQQAFPAAYSFARYTQSLGGPSSPHYLRLSAPSALIGPHQSHYYSYETQQNGGYDGSKLQYEASAMAPAAYAAQEQIPLPYFTHPGAVHYGSHLYHPPTPTSKAAVALPPAAAAGGGNQAQPRVASAGQQHVADVDAARDNTVVKYP